MSNQNQNDTDILNFDKSRVYVIRYSKGENWVEGKSIMEQDLIAHGKYMETSLNDGKLLLGGPLMSKAGGMVVLHNVSKSYVDEFIATDPGVTNGVFKAEIEDWFVAFKGLKLL